MTAPSLFASSGAAGKAVALANAATVLILPVTWFLPLLKSSAFLFIKSQISIVSGATELYESDFFLFLVIVVFAMIMPLVKSMLYVWIWFGNISEHKGMLWLGGAAAKLSMTDVFLLALAIIGVKGLGVGSIEVLSGLYVFAAVVIGSTAISIYTDVQVKRVGAVSDETPAEPADPATPA